MGCKVLPLAEKTQTTCSYKLGRFYCKSPMFFLFPKLHNVQTFSDTNLVKYGPLRNFTSRSSWDVTMTIAKQKFNNGELQIQ